MHRGLAGRLADEADAAQYGGDGRGTFRVGIERVHLEEDTGKSQHMGGATGRIHGAEYSLVDDNRAASHWWRSSPSRWRAPACWRLRWRTPT